MAGKEGGSSKDKKGKKAHKNKPTSEKFKMYNSSGVKKNRFCVKCGPGVFLANHGTRLHCGKCGYTEFVKK